MNIEVEIRSFISEKQYKDLIEFFNKNSQFLNEDFQETYYFDTKDDIRIQRNNFFAKIWMKKGKVHDEMREETEIKFDKNDFEKIEELFNKIGVNIKIKWFRNRHEFNWDGIKVCVGYTRGYGYILELEKMSDENNKEKALEELKEKLKLLNIQLTSKEEFEKKFEYYKNNWKILIGK